MVMKFLNKLKRIGYAKSLKHAIRLNLDDCRLSVVYVRISKTPGKSTFEYRMTTKCSNIHRTGFGNDDLINLFNDDGFIAIDVALGEITEQILLSKDEYVNMNTIFCILNDYKNLKIFNYEKKSWDSILSEEFHEKFKFEI